MNVASLELCKELYELSGWIDTSVWFGNGDTSWIKRYSYGTHFKDGDVPAYDLGYLLRKLPSSIPSHEYPKDRAYLWTRKDENDPGDIGKGYVYFAWYTAIGEDLSDFGAHADAPEDAVTKLAIELFRSGVLKRDA